MSDINVTPMVDVMLVLLVIFMVTAPLLQHGVTVDLPDVNAEAVADDEERVVITLTQDRKICLGDVLVPRAGLESKLKANTRLKKDGAVFLHADHRLDYGFVVEMMALLQASGVRNMGMMTDPVTER